MAVYKVPQDVEADDKLLGPFSFRQFIYLIIVCVAGAIAWMLGSLFIPLALIPLPVILFFGAIALPLKKDQPMETYVAALISFYTKPRKRLWEPDGLVSVMEITESQKPEIIRVKNLTQSEAVKRLVYLADIADSEGWSVRNISKPTGSSLQSDILLEASSTEDALDESNNLARNFNQMISQSDIAHKQEAMNRMQQQMYSTAQPVAQPLNQAVANNIPTNTPPVVDPAQQQIYSTAQPVAQPLNQAVANNIPTNTPPVVDPAQQAPRNDNDVINYNPYPVMRQSVVQPSGQDETQQLQQEKPQEIIPPTVDKEVVSPDILNLVNNSDLSIETIAHEADRIKKKEEAEDMTEEVVISLH